MPGPVPSHITGFNGGAANVASAEPECMARVAAVALGWTAIEKSLVNFVNCALGSAHMQSEHVVGQSGNWVAKKAMEQAETIRTRIKLIDSLVEPLIQGSEFQERWRDLRERLKRNSRVRNEIIHAMWAYTTELPGELVRLRPNHQERWTVADFSDVLTRFNELDADIHQLTHDMGAAKAIGLLANPPAY